MTRYVIIGAGAVGASLAAQFELSGIKYALVGRGAQIASIIEQGLSYQRPSGTQQIRLNAFDISAPPELAPDDILLLTVKTQDAAATLADWSWRQVSGVEGLTATQLPVVTFQNGLATEALALRTFANVYGASILTPARFTQTGAVAAAGNPQVGVVTIGRFPAGSDETAKEIAADLTRANYLAETSSDIRRWKSAKLLHNVRNALDLFDGEDDLRASIAEALVNEARQALEVAGYNLASPSERAVDISGWSIAQNSGIQPGQQSTWQSFARGASSEVDFLNGEIVLLGRLHNVATPYNEAIQSLAGRLAHQGGFSKAVPLDAILSFVGQLHERDKTGLAAAQ
ncbi:ketopantoate reductase family protein [Agrobacterium tumefaciens]|uniref:ketopantoate reductase family protein n=1 Tax=Agrobacterium tumefaciens TaxID=358 RepID=UPI001573E0F4|nr:ketopantoate reductase family protein [Agrobacterium tumefaciens]NSZ65277.1 ketopantoate reductase family protein [Agrobacterium tumefaciens]NTA71648.1 ketopantoate reductase family protein [Agrobacterium tumefaciens]WIE40125.1 ketopantoate reductase family protein [Agrobacterium tumefaciens]